MAANFRPYFAPPSLRVDTRWNVEPFSNAVQQYVNRERMSAIGQAEDPLQAARDLGELGIAANLIKQDQSWEQIDETQRQNAATNKFNQGRLGISQEELRLKRDQNAATNKFNQGRLGISQEELRLKREEAARAAALMPYKIEKLKNSTDLQAEYRARAEAAARYGITPDMPEYKPFVLKNLWPGSGQNGYKTLKDRVHAGGTLRKEFTNVTKNWQIIDDSFNKIRNVERSGPGDLALIFSYMKMLDPNSVVREGEFATAENAGGVPQRLIGLYNRMINGQRLEEALRKQFMQQASRYHQTAKKQYEADVARYTAIAKRYQLDPNNIVPQTDAPPAAQPSLPGTVVDGGNDPLGIRR